MPVQLLFQCVRNRCCFNKMFYIFIFSLFCQVWSENVNVVTKSGPIVGQNEGDFTTFFGVPYAAVDEDNPFGSSKDYPNFTEPFQATDHSIKCPQIGKDGKYTGILQCLRLNIFVPNTTAENLAVFVWFHGGGYMRGSAGEYGGKYLVKHDIIVITVNYRLGPYGFLCIDEEFPGNQGLKDQVASLKWIKENIKEFNGDPNKVTIGGESYGGGSVDLHLYSNYDKMFDKAIIQSGSMFAEGMFVNGDRRAAKKIANYLKNHEKINDPLTFLAETDPAQVLAAANNLSLVFRPCKEKIYGDTEHFVTRNPYRLYADERIKNTPILIGYNSKETFKTFVDQPDEFYTNLGDYFSDKIKRNFVFSDREMKKISEIVKTFYLGSKTVSKEAILELIDFSSDIMLNHAVEYTVKKLLKQEAVVYKYLFSYTGGSDFKNVTGVGAYHTEELQYLFDMGTELQTEEQKMIRDRMTTMWANFIKYGNPTPETSELLLWPVATKSSRPYLNIDVDMTQSDGLYHSRMAFWELFRRNYWECSVMVEKSYRCRRD